MQVPDRLRRGPSEDWAFHRQVLKAYRHIADDLLGYRVADEDIT